MKKYLFIALLGMLSSCIPVPVHAQTPREVENKDILFQASLAVQQILTSTTWKRTDANAVLCFQKDNSYYLELPNKNKTENLLIGNWTADYGYLTIIMDGKFLKACKILSITPYAIKLLDDDVIFTLKATH